MKRFLTLIPLALVLCICAACGPSNTVRLLYKPADSSTLAAPNAPSVAVVQFTDNRANPQLGVRRDNSNFESNVPVVEWVSRSLADELTKQGLRVTYAENLGQARAAAPQYIVTGSVEEVWLKEPSTTDLNTSMRATVSMSHKDKHLFTESLSSSQSRSGLPSSTAAEEILLESMQEIVQPAAQKIRQHIGK